MNSKLFQLNVQFRALLLESGEHGTVHVVTRWTS
jgi:hypothetical protein